MWFWTIPKLFKRILDQQFEILENQRTEVWVAGVRYRALMKELNVLRLLCSRPGPLHLVIVGDDLMADTILFKIAMMPKSAADVVRRELSLLFQDGTTKQLELPADALESEVLSGPQDTEVTVGLVDVDNEGNRSPERVATFKLLDTVAPPMPGELGIQIVGEELAVEPVPVEDPVPADEPVLADETVDPAPAEDPPAEEAAPETPPEETLG